MAVGGTHILILTLFGAHTRQPSMSIYIREHVSLKEYTTFKTGGVARFFCEVHTVNELKEVLTQHTKFFILGGGSNILIGDYDGLVIKMSIDNAGRNWDDFVAESTAKGNYGLENLSYIPGTVGAAPVQNIGAYGVEVGDRIEKVHTIHAHTLNERIFTKEECQFSYRNSIFKKEKEWIITHVEFNFTNEINTSYKGLENLKTPEEIRDAVIKIRKEKLPDWYVLGTAGSFFKNPIITKLKYEDLKNKYPELPFFEVDSERVKIPLAWVIDKICGMKDFKVGNVGTYKNQALVIVNYGGATAKEVDDFAKKIESIVLEKTGLTIEREVENII
jgi:UDP-N-acetylmuramate dehydrogenase